MLIKLDSVIYCSSEHPNYPASNLLIFPPRTDHGWRCAKPGLMIANVILKLQESSTITGLDIANYRSCIVNITGSTNDDPDNWIPIINHEFMSNDDAINNKFRDQFMIFTKTELKTNIDKIKFDRINVTCMQSANPRELFGLNQLVLKTELVIENNIDLSILLRPKAKAANHENISNFKKKYYNLFPEKQKIRTETLEELKKVAHDKVLARKRAEEEEKMNKERQKETMEDDYHQLTPLEETSSMSDLSDSNYNMRLTGVLRTPFGDPIPEPSKEDKKANEKRKEIEEKLREKERLKEQEKEKEMMRNRNKNSSQEKVSLSQQCKSPLQAKNVMKKCSECISNSSNSICLNCHRLSAASQTPSPIKKLKMVNKKPRKLFTKLMDDVSFALSGYVNPQRDEIRRKALKMGARYVADPDNATKKCTHLICAFKKTPKFQQLHGTGTKIVGHAYIEECYDHKKRFPWRRYALTDSDQEAEESEEEIETTLLKADENNVYNLDTDSD